MTIQGLVTFGLTISVFLAVLGIGTQVALADLYSLLRQPRRLIRSLFAMYVLAPVITVVVCRLFALHPAMIVALVTLTVAPVGALFSQAMLPLVTPGRAAYARGLFFASTVLSVVLTPLVVEVIQAIRGADIHISPISIAEIVVGSVLLPLGIGLALGRWRPRSQRWVPTIQKASSTILVLCQLGLILGALPLTIEAFREGTLMAVAMIGFLALTAGHLLGGPDEDDRTVLAFATASRHPGVAGAVASLTDQPLAPVVLLLAVVLIELAVVPYKLWRKRMRTIGDPIHQRGGP